MQPEKEEETKKPAFSLNLSDEDDEDDLDEDFINEDFYGDDDEDDNGVLGSVKNIMKQYSIK